jgi:RHS repeat-associated protein
MVNRALAVALTICCVMALWCSIAVAHANAPVERYPHRDALGRLVAEVQDGERIGYELDALGRRVGRALPEAAGGAHTRYGYDAFGAFVSVAHTPSPGATPMRLEVGRDVLGRQTARRFDGGFGEARRYDAMDRLVEQLVTRDGVETALSERRYRYDEAGRPLDIDDGRWGRTSYRYDPLGQLLSAERSGGPAGGALREVFDYDVTGSLQHMLSSLGGGDSAAPWQLEPGNVLVAQDGTRYVNDACKRRVEKREHEQLTRYRWDCRDRLREVDLPDGRRVRYRYDAFARRVSKVVEAPKADAGERLEAALSGTPLAKARAVTTRFLWDGDVLCAELRDGGGEGAARVHVHEPGSFVPLMQSEGPRVFAVVTDHLGMPKELVGDGGTVAWAAAHSAWGKVVQVDGGDVASPFRLLGQYHDDETGLCYTRFRYFDPDAGRWCSPDPLGLLGGPNLCAFNGPVSAAIDPWGLACDPPPTHLHHTIPREIRKPRNPTKRGLLPPHLEEHPDIKGRAGKPNRWPVPEGEHIDLHKRNRPGGDFNQRWKDEIEALRERKPDPATWTPDDIVNIRDRLVDEFDIEKYRPKP